MVAANKDMMVMDRRREEVLCYLRRCLDPHLRTAEVLLELTPLEFYIDR